MRCHSLVGLNDKGMPNTHQASHYFGRGKENTRYDPDNVDCLCGACHRIWGSDDRESYRDFKISQLGEDGLVKMRVRSHQYCKRDEKLRKLQAKTLLEELKKGPKALS